MTIYKGESLMRIRILFLLIFVITSCSLHASKTLKFTYVQHSKIAEITKQILSEAYKRLDIKVSFEPLPAKRALYVANDGLKYDGELHRIAGIEKKFSNLLAVPVVIYSLEGMVISKKVQFDVENWDSLRPYKIGVRRGIVFAVEGTKEMNPLILNSNEHLFKMLNSSRFDIVVASRITAVSHLKKKENHKLQVIEPPIEVYKLYHYLHKKNIKLLPKIKKVLQDMSDEGLIEKYKDDFLKVLSIPAT